MIELYIDGQPLDIAQSAEVGVTFAIADVEDPENSTSGYSVSVEVPFSPRNREVLRFSEQVFSREQFNNQLHAAEYVVDGTTILSGTAYMEKYSYRVGGEGSFHLSVLGATYEWVQRAKKQINELRSSETVLYRMGDVYDNSKSQRTSLIKFIPVDRGAFYVKDAEDEFVPRTTLHLFDYHPFINVQKLLELIFEGYTVRTSLDSLFSKLYFSGSFPETEDLSFVQDENGFKAGTSMTEAISQPINTQLNLFDVLDDNERECFSNGVLHADLFTVYAPKNKLSAMFEIRLFYLSKMPLRVGLTNYHVDTFIFGLTSEAAPSPDQFYFPVEKSEEYDNRCTSPAQVTETGWVYIRLTVPESVLAFYSTVIIRDEQGGNSDTLTAVNGRWYAFNIRVANTLAIRLYNTQQEEYFDIDLIKGAQVEILPLPLQGLTFSQTLYTNPYTLGPDDATGSTRFKMLCGTFHSTGRPEDTGGLEVYVSEESTIQPVIGNYIGFEEEVSIQTVGGTRRQMDFIASLRQMFNLMFYTNSVTREVYIEPRSAFFEPRGGYIDWSAKIDQSKEVILEELGADMGTSLKLSYADGGEVIKRHNKKQGKPQELGVYKVPLLNKTGDEETELINPLFAPCVTRKVPGIGMTLLQNEVETSEEVITDVDLDITPTIGYFSGQARRGTGDDLLLYPLYPRMIFQSSEAGINLGFEDLKAGGKVLRGLHRYYDDNVYLYNFGRRLTLYLHLTPKDIEIVLMPGRYRCDLRTVFLLEWEGEKIPCWLEKIEDYTPATGGATKCSFLVDPRLSVCPLIILKEKDTILTHGGTAIGYPESGV